jgi:dTMP kinase
MTKRGRFIVVEGLEGAGKSTAIQTIKQYVQDFIPEIVLTREPGGTRVGEAVRQLIKENIAGEMLKPLSELLLLYAARVQLLEQIIRPALMRGCWVLADRFELSSFAYQGGGRRLDRQMISNLSALCLQGFKPDLILFLDVSPEQGLVRVKNRGAKDRIEQESLVFFRRVAKAYHQMMQSMDNVIVIDANQSIELVQESVLAQLKTFINTHAITCN